MTTQTIQDLARQLGGTTASIQEHSKAAYAAARTIHDGCDDSETVRLQTLALRTALHRVEDLANHAQLLLDELETEAGLVDKNGRRFDEVPR